MRRDERRSHLLYCHLQTSVGTRVTVDDRRTRWSNRRECDRCRPRSEFKSEDGSRWAELAPQERHFFEVAVDETSNPTAAFILIDGAPLGLPILLRRLPPSDKTCPPLKLWKLPHELLAASRGRCVTPIRTKAYGGGDDWPHATSSDDYLCYWRAEEERVSAGLVGWHGKVASAELSAALSDTRPRLATATLLRGAPPRTVANFALYYRAIGFDSVYLFFDAPHEDGAAMAAVRGMEGVIVIECTDAYWKEQRKTNSFFKRSSSNDSKHSESYTCSVEHFDKGDVQARQCAAIQDGIERARADGIDWLLHVDIDELWYSPLESVQRDGAAAFFAAVHPSVSQLCFLNHEAVPPQPHTDGDGGSDAADGVTGDSHGSCWFEDVRLFKPHEAFTRGFAENEERRRKADANRHNSRCRRDDKKDRNLFVLGKEEDEEEEEEDPAKARLDAWTKSLDDHFDEAVRQTHTQRANYLNAEEKRSHKHDVEGLRAKQQAAIAKQEERDARLKERPARKEVRRRKRSSGDPVLREEADVESEASDQEERRERLEISQAAAGEFKYYHAHDQGKSAVRLLPGLAHYRVPNAGVHGFGKVGGDSHTCEGAGAPVILHYACCGFHNWRTKYEMLTTKPRFEGAKQASLGSYQHGRHMRACSRIAVQVQVLHQSVRWMPMV